MKRFCWFIAALCGMGMAMAQNLPRSSNLGASAADSGRNSLRTATQPLTPKSALQTEHKTSLPPNVTGNTRSQSAELASLERHSVSAPRTKPAPVRKAPPVNSSSSRASRAPAINATYHKPAGGKTAGPSNNGTYGNRVGR